MDVRFFLAFFLTELFSVVFLLFKTPLKMSHFPDSLRGLKEILTSPFLALGMFNFLFEGKLGEILAPVTGITNQFHLAIQHHKNSEVQEIISSSSTLNLSQLSESGVAPIHVACRYNNTFALDLILSRGNTCGFFP
jgi:hypothetical protein